MSTASQTAKTKAPLFTKGDRVKLWGKSKVVGTVDEVWTEDGATMVEVVWDVSGCASTVRSYQLQFAA